MAKFTDSTDEELIVFCQNGDNEAMDVLLDRYKKLVRKLSREYFLVGAETEDLIQEGLIGLFKAIRDYKTGKNIQFRSFAKLCIRRQLITAIKQSQRHKHQPLNNYVSLTYKEYDENPLMELIESEVLSPENIVISFEGIKNLNEKIKNDLSAFEKKVLTKFLEGMSYIEISENLKSNSKAVDNALQRIKKKLNGGK